jgi:sec-independent protein translocase protein TatC
MASALKPIGHEDRLSLVEHLDELRTRIIICILTFSVAFGLCLWQDDRVLQVMNRSLEHATQFKKNSKDPFEQSATYDATLKAFAQRSQAFAQAVAGEESVSPTTRAAAQDMARAAGTVVRAAPKVTGRRPVTLGVGEPFTATVKVAAWAALLISLPILLYQAYAFVLPAFSPRERQVAVPMMLLIPLLFIAGVVFAYYMVLPNAIRFLQNFNDDSFDILLQARDYYSFSIMVLAAMGLCFQVPIGILAITRVGIVSTQQLRKGRRYAILVIAVVAMLLPGQDPITMLSLMVPLIVLYEGSILLCILLDRRAARVRAREEAKSAAVARGNELVPLDSED